MVLPTRCVVIVLLLVIAVSNSIDACPVRIASLCECQAYLTGLQLNCTLQNFTAVLEVLRELRAPVFQLIVSDSPIPLLKKEHLNGLSIRELEFNKNGMADIEPDAFIYQAESLESLVVTGNALTAIPKLDYLPRLRRLDLIDNKINAIPDKVLAGNPRIQELRLEGNAICSMSPTALQEVKEAIELVDLSRNCLRSIPALNLRGAPRLAYVDLSHNQITDLQDLSFMNNPALLEVRLSGNGITGIKPLSFMNVPKLAQLYLNDNEINRLDPDKFKHVPALKFLDISGNKITKLPTSAFKELSQLDMINLSENEIKTVDSLAFRTIPNLRAISLKANGLQLLSRNAFEDLPSMIQLDLSNNSLESIGPDQFAGMPELQHLSLRNNQIRVIESKPFATVPDLTTLDLGANGLTDIPADAFEGLKKLTWLDLCCNGIENLKESTFKRKITNIILHDNKLKCDDRLDWFIGYLVQNGVKTYLPNEEEVTCSSPPEYAGTKLRELMIQKANDTLYSKFKELMPGGENSQLPFGNLLPGLKEIPALKNGVPAITQGISSLNTMTRMIPALNKVPGLSALTDMDTYLPTGDRSGDLEPLIQDIADPLTQMATRGRARAGEVNDLVRSIPRLAKSLPTLPGSKPVFDMSKLSPELIKHVMNGNTVPGISRKSMEGIKRTFMEQMAEAARAALAGLDKTPSGAPVSKLLFPLKELPVEMVQNVLQGKTLPGISEEDTKAIKDYYMNQAVGGGTTSSPGVAKGGRAGRVKGGMLPADMLRQLAKEIDLAQLPDELLQKIANGERITLEMVPRDIIDLLQSNNPDLAQRLSDALLSSSDTPSDKPSGGEGMGAGDRAPLFSKGQVYDLGSVSNDISDPLRVEGNTNIPLYTGIGLACVGALTFGTVAYLCFKRSKQEDLDKTAMFAGSPKSVGSLNLGNNNSMYIPPTLPPGKDYQPSEYETFRGQQSMYYQGYS